jgi:hypothetical protein
MDTNKRKEDTTTQRADTLRSDDPETNPDPITKAPGSHPVGTAIGAAAGGAAGVGGAIAAGAAIGSVVGPVGTAIGVAAGAVAGGLIGHAVAESVNPTVEHKYWQETFATRPYVTPNSTYDEYGPAYQFGWESRQRYAGRTFDEVEADMERDWPQARGQSNLAWNDARQAAREAWDRVTRSPEDRV